VKRQHQENQTIAQTPRLKPRADLGCSAKDTITGSEGFVMGLKRTFYVHRRVAVEACFCLWIYGHFEEGLISSFKYFLANDHFHVRGDA
jgi:hypothetical protein